MRVYPHNLFAEALVTTGALGTTCLIVAVIGGLRHAVGLIRVRSPHSWVAVIFIQHFVGAQFSGAVWSLDIFWPLLAFMITGSSTSRAPNLCFADAAGMQYTETVAREADSPPKLNEI